MVLLGIVKWNTGRVKLCALGGNVNKNGGQFPLMAKMLFLSCPFRVALEYVFMWPDKGVHF